MVTNIALVAVLVVMVALYMVRRKSRLNSDEY